jgi:PA14 domain/Glycosyl hydrolases family 2, sugar binding domain/Fn3 associated/Glycosyl hydrolases family 2/Glycosyl hydrolases family 2, TIM barrel domain
MLSRKLKIPFYNIYFLFFTLVVWSCSSSSLVWKSVKGPLMTEWGQKLKTENVLTEYPRPQLKRDKWKNLNGLWEYSIVSKEKSAPSIYQGKIVVPFPIESSLSGVKKNVGEKNRLFYRRYFTIPEEWGNKNVVLNFGAVDFESEVFVNGQIVGKHKGGYDAFSFDITKYLDRHSKNEIVVSAYDPIDAGTQPHGKQVKEPGGIMYTSVTGIWQTVWLEPVMSNCIKDVRIIPNIDDSNINISVITTNKQSGNLAEVSVFVDNKEAQKFSLNTNESRVVNIKDMKLWSPESPFLYEIKVELLDEKNEPTDIVESYFGMRKSSLGKDKNGITRIMLNNKFVFQHGFLDQGWWPDGLYTAPTDEALKYDIEMTKKMGFNLARKHVKVEPQRWYYWCDKLGLLVWQDMPSGEKGIAPHEPDIERSEESSTQYMTELKEMIDQFYSHPSIIVWVPFNEGWGQWETEKVTKQIKEWDPSRLVISASGWTDRGTGDINDMHSYPGPNMPPVEKDRAVVLGEYGGLGYPVKGHTWKKEDNWGYVNYANEEELITAYSILTRDLFVLKEKGLSAAVYTQTTDVEVEVNGLMTYDRKINKIDPDVLARINQGYFPPKIVAKSDLFLDSLEVALNKSADSDKIRYTIDGTEPTTNSKLYEKSLMLKKNTTLKAKAFWSDGAPSSLITKTFTKTTLAKGINLANPKSGVSYNYYENNDEDYLELPDFQTLTTIKSGVSNQISIAERKRNNNFSFTYHGFIKIDQEGIYSFYISSNDGSILKIGDDLLVIDNDGQHGMNEKQGSIGLKKGFHKIEVDFFQAKGGNGLKVSYDGPGFDKTEIPATKLFH